MTSFDGMCALITGSASGLGAATAVALARGGARVIVNYRASAQEADETANLCRAANAAVKVVQANVAIDDDCRRLAGAVSEGGRLDILVNIASATKHVANPADLDALSAEDFQQIFTVNAICPGYMDTPWWLDGAGQEAADKLREAIKGGGPLRVASRPEDIAEVVTFLAGPASRHMTGSIVPVDAGFRLLVSIAPSDARR